MKMKINKAKFEIEFFANTKKNSDWWEFQLPTIEVSHISRTLTIAACFAFWIAGVKTTRVIDESDETE